MMLPIVTGSRLPRKFPQVSSGKSDAVLPTAFQNEVGSAGLDEKAHRNEVNIGNAMLKASRGECGDGRDSRDNPVDVRASAEAHPYCQAHKCIAHNTECQRRDESE